METIRIIRVPNEWESVELLGVKFTYWEDVGINKKSYHQSALNLAKALLDIGCLVRVRRNVYKESINENGNTVKSVGTEIDLTLVTEKEEKPLKDTK